MWLTLFVLSLLTILILILLVNVQVLLYTNSMILKEFELLRAEQADTIFINSLASMPMFSTGFQEPVKENEKEDETTTVEFTPEGPIPE